MKFLKKQAATRTREWRDRAPRAKRRWRGRLTEANAWQGKLQMTRPRDPRGRVTEVMHQKLQKTLIANSEALFGPNPSPEGIDQRLWSGRMHPFKESLHFSKFSWFRFSFEREILSSLLGLGFRISLSFRSDSRSQVQCSFTLYLSLTFRYFNAYISYVAYLAYEFFHVTDYIFELMLFEVFQFNIAFSYLHYCYSHLKAFLFQ